MTKTELVQVNRIKYEGPGGPNQILFGTDSWTRTGIRHMLTADFNTGMITCNCETGRMHHRYIDILTGEGNPCKHIRCVFKLCQRILEQQEG